MGYLKSNGILRALGVIVHFDSFRALDNHVALGLVGTRRHLNRKTPSFLGEACEDF